MMGVRNPTIAAAVAVGTDDPVKARLNDAVVELALQFGTLFNGRVTLFHAWQPFVEDRAREHATHDEFAAYVERARLRAQWHLAALCRAHELNSGRLRIALMRGAVETALPRFVVAERVDLVVIGSTGRGGLARLLRGSTAERLLRKLPCSTLICRDAEASWGPAAFAKATAGQR